MENKAMYLSTYEERENGSMYEEAYDGHNLSKLNLCDEGKENNKLCMSILGCLALVWTSAKKNMQVFEVGGEYVL